VDDLIRNHPANPWLRPIRAPTVPRVIQSFPGEGFEALRRTGDARALHEGRLIFSLGSYNFDLDASLATVQHYLAGYGGAPIAASDVDLLISIVRSQLAGIHLLLHERAAYLTSLAQYPGAREFLVRAQQHLEWSEVSETTHISTALQEYWDANRSRRSNQHPQPYQPQQQPQQQQQQQPQQQQQQQPQPNPANPAAGRGRGRGRGRGAGGQ
jgi:hypothetical protein